VVELPVALQKDTLMLLLGLVALEVCDSNLGSLPVAMATAAAPNLRLLCLNGSPEAANAFLSSGGQHCSTAASSMHVDGALAQAVPAPPSGPDAPLRVLSLCGNPAAMMDMVLTPPLIWRTPPLSGLRYLAVTIAGDVRRLRDHSRLKTALLSSVAAALQCMPRLEHLVLNAPTPPVPGPFHCVHGPTVLLAQLPLLTTLHTLDLSAVRVSPQQLPPSLTRLTTWLFHGRDERLVSPGALRAHLPKLRAVWLAPRSHFAPPLPAASHWAFATELTTLTCLDLTRLSPTPLDEAALATLTNVVGGTAIGALSALQELRILRLLGLPLSARLESPDFRALPTVLRQLTLLEELSISVTPLCPKDTVAAICAAINWARACLCAASHVRRLVLGMADLPPPVLPPLRGTAVERLLPHLEWLLVRMDPSLGESGREEWLEARSWLEGTLPSNVQVGLYDEACLRTGTSGFTMPWEPNPGDPRALFDRYAREVHTS
jgi:hypothetical protein